jgi:hypothetical protein
MRKTAHSNKELTPCGVDSKVGTVALLSTLKNELCKARVDVKLLILQLGKHVTVKPAPKYRPGMSDDVALAIGKTGKQGHGGKGGSIGAAARSRSLDLPHSSEDGSEVEDGSGDENGSEDEDEDDREKEEEEDDHEKEDEDEDEYDSDGEYGDYDTEIRSRKVTPHKPAALPVRQREARDYGDVASDGAASVGGASLPFDGDAGFLEERHDLGGGLPGSEAIVISDLASCSSTAAPRRGREPARTSEDVSPLAPLRAWRREAAGDLPVELHFDRGAPLLKQMLLAVESIPVDDCDRALGAHVRLHLVGQPAPMGYHESDEALNDLICRCNDELGTVAAAAPFRRVGDGPGAALVPSSDDVAEPWWSWASFGRYLVFSLLHECWPAQLHVALVKRLGLVI